MTVRALGVDLLLAAAVALYASLLFTGDGGPRDLIDVAMLGVACGAMILRRCAPQALLAIAISLQVLQDVTDRHEAYTTWVLSIGLFSVVAIARVWVGAIVWAAVSTIYLLSAGDIELSAAFVGSALGFFASAWAAGLVVRRHEETITQLKLAASRVEASIADREQMAVMEERNRLRDDLHDIVGHHINVAAVLADAARAAHCRDEQRLLSSLEGIGAACRSALDEMDKATTWLSHEPDVEPTPSLRDLEQVIASLRLTGLTVEPYIAVTSSELDRLDEVVSATATRFLREALTNVLKHSTRPWCRIELNAESETLIVKVTSAPALVQGDHATLYSAGGSGLHRLRHRIALLGGAVKVQSLVSGFVQQAVFPLPPRQPR